MKKIFFLLLFFILLLAISWGVFFLYKLNYFENKVTIIPGTSSILDTLGSLSQRESALSEARDGRINILLLGIAGKGKPGQYLTDTIMIASINIKTGQVALLSLPRDLMATIPEKNIQMKINSVYQHGVSGENDESRGAEEIKQVVEGITSLHIDRWVLLNFEGFQKIIDSIGGINIMNERDIYDPRYPGPNYSYETFELKKGFHHLDGATALKYARERHNDPQSDFGRAKRQQKILEAAKNKIFSAQTYLNVIAINDLFNAVGDNIRTDVSQSEFPFFLELMQKVDTQNVTNEVVDAWSSDSLLKVSHVEWNGTRAFVLVPRVGNWSEIHDLAQNIFDLNTLKRRQEEISGENANIFIIDKSGANLSAKISRLLRDNFNHRNVALLKDSDKRTEAKTYVYDLGGARMPFTLDELAKKLPAKINGTLPESYKTITQNVSPDFLIVIGEDLISRYNMEEASLEEYKNAPETNEYTEFIKN